ncbi:tRNA lysidine(34) synthetase TilS [Falsiroseomonas sp.]|uniref:tRNA lysidine(34) synthetase TilS n=1 Tax=Falsiroseomonas sp. TaxID=2870721 RepID=UPI00356A7D28
MRAAAPSAAEPGGLPAPPGLSADAAPVTTAEFAALMAPLGPFGPAPCLVAGVSGGPHSLALALLAESWVRCRGGVLLAAVCDHGLRPESAAEAAGVAAMLAARGIAAEVLTLRLAPGGGVQERAREARLAALSELCAARGAPWLLLGHHIADQAETLLLRALAGSGAAGLAAMAPVRPAATALVLRPLLGLPPARLEAVVAAAGLAPVRDPSNTEPRFLRVRLRAVLGDPGGVGAATAALAEAAGRFSARRRQVEAAVADRLAEAASMHEAGFARLDLVALGQDAVARAALGALLRAVGGAAFAPAEAAVAALLARGEGTLGGAVLRRSGLLLRESAALAPPVPARRGALWDARFRLAGDAPPRALFGAAGKAARALPRPAWIPAAVVPTLPALLYDERLAVVPALAYPSPDIAARHAVFFAPHAGAVA